MPAVFLNIYATAVHFCSTLGHHARKPYPGKLLGLPSPCTDIMFN